MEVDINYDFDMRPPYEMLAGLHESQLMELAGDIDMYLELSPEDEAFWQALKLLCQEQVALVTGKRQPVSREVQEVFQNQSLEELIDLRKSIAEQLKEGEDPEYWDALYKRSEIEIARATLKKIHAAKLQERLARIEVAKRDAERDRLQEVLRSKMERDRQEAEAAGASGVLHHVGTDDRSSQANSSAKVSSVDAGVAAPPPSQSGSGRRPRQKLVLEDLVEEEDEVEAEDQEWREQDARIQQLTEEARHIDYLLEQQVGDPDFERPDAYGGQGMLTEQELMQVEMERAPEENEEAFADEVEAELSLAASIQPKWYDKYAPRKPRYFNRVKTGYEWNKYNSTHYTAENPPPKVVHGYRFNIFYTDLVDPSKSPTFKIEPIPGNSDWVILRFRAGPPYLDLLFKIVNKEWQKDSRFGFKAVFERGVLRLWFNFKRTRYKR